jgi:hypothetical protein
MELRNYNAAGANNPTIYSDLISKRNELQNLTLIESGMMTARNVLGINDLVLSEISPGVFTTGSISKFRGSGPLPANIDTTIVHPPNFMDPTRAAIPALAVIPLAMWGAGEGIQTWLGNVGGSMYGAASKIPNNPIIPPAFANFAIGAGLAVAGTLPFFLQAPVNLAAGGSAIAQNPAGAPKLATDFLTTMGQNLWSREQTNPGSIAGTLFGMYVGGKIIEAGFERIPFSLEQITPGIGAGKVSVQTESGTMTDYHIISGKLPWEEYGASGRALATYVTGESGTKLLFGDTALQNYIRGTTITKMAIPVDIENVEVSPGVSTFTKNLMIVSRETNPEFVDLYQEFQKTSEIVNNPIQRYLFYRPQQTELIGELPFASASQATMEKIFATAEGRSDILFTGSRVNIRAFAAPYARGAESFGGTMADLDVLVDRASMPEVSHMWYDIIKQESPNAVLIEKGAPEFPQFSIHTGQGKFINAETFQEYSNVPRGMIAEAVGGSKVTIPGPAYGEMAKMSGAFRGATLEYSPEEGLDIVMGAGRAKDLPDLSSVARSMARDLYTPMKYDIGEFFQNIKTSGAQSAEALSDLAKQYAIKNVPQSAPMFGEFGEDILQNVNRNPEPLYSINPTRLGIAAGAIVGSALGILPKGIVLGLVGEDIAQLMSFEEAETLIYRGHYVPTTEEETLFTGLFSPGYEFGRAGTGIYKNAAGTIYGPAQVLQDTGTYFRGTPAADIGTYAYRGTPAPYQPSLIEPDYYPGAAPAPGYNPLTYAPEPKYSPGQYAPSVYNPAPLYDLGTYNPATYTPEPTYMPFNYNPSPLYNPLPYTPTTPPYNPPPSPHVPPYIPPPSYTPGGGGYTPGGGTTTGGGGGGGTTGGGTTGITWITKPEELPIYWERSKRKKHPARFLELFSFEMGTTSPVPTRFGLGGVNTRALGRQPARFMELFSLEEGTTSAIPTRFGKGGVNARAQRGNPEARFIPGYRGYARKILAPEDIAPQGLFDIVGKGQRKGRKRTVWENMIS